MKKTIAYSVLMLAVSCLISSYELPKGWFKAGSEPDKYEMGIDPGSHNGKNAATIKSTEKKIKGFGTLMQTSLPEKYLNKRVKMTGYLKTENVDEWAGLWFRVDGDDPKKSLSFDNMWDRHLKGTNDWQKYEIVLDVPARATKLAYGALLGGTGQIWFDDIAFEIVSDITPVTGKAAKEPNNLSFDE